MPCKTASCRALGGKTKTFYKGCIKGPEAVSHQITVQGTIASKRLLLGKNHLFTARKVSQCFNDVKQRTFRPPLPAKVKLTVFKLEASNACKEVIIARDYDSSIKMLEISATIILFRLKRNHVVYYSINNSSLFSAPWVFLTIFFSFHIDYREEKRREKKPYSEKNSRKYIQRLPVSLQQGEF